MRLRIQTIPPLPEVKAWFNPEVPVATIAELKTAICFGIPVLKDNDIRGDNIQLLLDEFELMDDSPFSTVRDNDLLVVKLASGKMLITEAPRSKKRKRASLEAIAQSHAVVQKPRILMPTPNASSVSAVRNGSSSNDSSDDSDSSSSSSSSSSSGSSSASSSSSSSSPSSSFSSSPPTAQSSKLPEKLKALAAQKLSASSVKMSSQSRPHTVPPGSGNFSTRSRNKRRRAKARIEKAQPQLAPKPPKGSSEANLLPLGARSVTNTSKNACINFAQSVVEKVASLQGPDAMVVDDDASSHQDRTAAKEKPAASELGSTPERNASEPRPIVDQEMASDYREPQEEDFEDFLAFRDAVPSTSQLVQVVSSKTTETTSYISTQRNTSMSVTIRSRSPSSQPQPKNPSAIKLTVPPSSHRHSSSPGSSPLSPLTPLSSPGNALLDLSVNDGVEDGGVNVGGVPTETGASQPVSFRVPILSPSPPPDASPAATELQAPGTLSVPAPTPTPAQTPSINIPTFKAPARSSTTTKKTPAKRNRRREGPAGDVASALNNAFGSNADLGEWLPGMLDDEDREEEALPSPPSRTASSSRRSSTALPGRCNSWSNHHQSSNGNQPVLMSSLGNKNKKKGYKQSLSAPIPQKIVFSDDGVPKIVLGGTETEERQSSISLSIRDTPPTSAVRDTPYVSPSKNASTNGTAFIPRPQLIPPSEIPVNQLPERVFVTSIDVEKGMWGKKKKKGGKRKDAEEYQNGDEDGLYGMNGYQDWDVEDDSETLQYPEAVPASKDGFDWDRADVLWEKGIDVVQLEQLATGKFVGWKELAVDPRTFTPEVLTFVARIVEAPRNDSQIVTVRPLIRPGAELEVEEEDDKYEMANIRNAKWRLLDLGHCL